MLNQGLIFLSRGINKGYYDKNIKEVFSMKIKGLIRDWHKRISLRILKVVGKLLKWTDEEMEETYAILESSFDNPII